MHQISIVIWRKKKQKNMFKNFKLNDSRLISATEQANMPRCVLLQLLCSEMATVTKRSSRGSNYFSLKKALRGAVFCFGLIKYSRIFLVEPTGCWRSMFFFIFQCFCCSVFFINGRISLETIYPFTHQRASNMWLNMEKKCCPNVSLSPCPLPLPISFAPTTLTRAINNSWASSNSRQRTHK